MGVPWIRSLGEILTLVIAIVIAFVTLGVYAGASEAGSDGRGVVMPLDDAYIHFQYARQLAAGEYSHYNPGQPPTSGATSLLYPFVLAFGVRVGLTGLSLSVWAMIVGFMALVASTVIVYRLTFHLLPPASNERVVSRWIIAARIGVPLLAAIAFAVNGGIAWHFMSGMETGLVVTALLIALERFAARKWGGALAWGAILAMLRPEGGVFALIVLAAVVLQNRALRREDDTIKRVWIGWVVLVIAAVAAQPVTNLILTGSPLASGGAAKSIFGAIPADYGEMIGRVIGNFARMIGGWSDLLLGTVGVPLVIGVLLAALAVFGLYTTLRSRSRRHLALLAIAWLIAGAAVISTLDTAFWHFKRYQMPMIGLLITFIPVGAVALRRIRPILMWGVLTAVVILSSAVWLFFPYLYQINVGYIVRQPLVMADWLRENTPADARVAVHDVGVMRYWGGRETIDMVGLTTRGAADSWRNGPGAVGEYLDHQRPDYIASYGEGHGLGLGYLAQTDLYGTPLAAFRVEPDADYQCCNVAVAAPMQGIYRPAWEAADRSDTPAALLQRLRGLGGMRLIDTVDVADIEDERAHDYQWGVTRRISGFPSEWHQWGTVGARDGTPTLMDGGRRMTGVESFTVNAEPGRDLVLITRVHSEAGGALVITADGAEVAPRTLPVLPGAWFEVATLIPGERIAGEQVTITLTPEGAGDYQPYTHFAYSGDYQPETCAGALTTWQDGAIVLAESEIVFADDGTARLSLAWSTDGHAAGDYKRFLHLIAVDEAGSEQIAAQADGYPAGGALPPGAWLPGCLRETVELPTLNLEPGRYRLAIGWYDPSTNARLEATGGDGAGRFFLPDGVINDANAP